MQLTKEIPSEFEISVYYRYILNDVTVDNVSKTPTATIQSVGHDNSKPASSVSTQYVKEVPNPAALSESLPIERQCAALTALGPAPYMGDILDNPDALWTEDIWTEKREEEARQRIAQQGANVNSFWRSKYESKAGSYWHDFYLRNTDKFYKDRHYLHVVFPELILDWRNGSPHGYSADPDTDHDKQPLRLLEVGCGVGNAVIPLLELNPRIHVTAIDFARSAIDILSRHPAVSETGRLAASVCCVVRDDLPVAPQSQDLILCMFVLSAIGPDHQLPALRKLAAALKPGGKLLLRDYGRCAVHCVSRRQARC